ncbi:hypothetical protein Pcinc_039656 [Petrolisthes cinctipes]|uniref:Uncharacterized protein n=1 Tax=Petrolisthes cinctipes TaxID=88211 RepID=A0AAE1BN76_PETCI|nr:hypothetical protein Pcinc_039656 [Petrolisthes cinctipes]
MQLANLEVRGRGQVQRSGEEEGVDEEEEQQGKKRAAGCVSGGNGARACGRRLKGVREEVLRREGRRRYEGERMCKCIRYKRGDREISGKCEIVNTGEKNRVVYRGGVNRHVNSPASNSLTTLKHNTMGCREETNDNSTFGSPHVAAGGVNSEVDFREG